MDKLREAAELLLRPEAPDPENEVVIVEVDYEFMLVRVPHAAWDHIWSAINNWAAEDGRNVQWSQTTEHRRWTARPKTQDPKEKEDVPPPTKK